MDQSFSAQVLTRKSHHKSKQASGAKKITLQNATDLQHIALTQPLECDPDQGLKITLQNATELQQISYVNKKK